MVSPRLVRTLYRALLASGRQLQSDIEAGRTLYNAIRSGAVESYAGVKRDWQREQQFRNRLLDMEAVKILTRQQAYVSLIRSGFEQPLVTDSAEAIDQRVDAAFSVLHDFDDQNAMVRKFQESGVYDPQRRSSEVDFAVGEQVVVSKEERGVVYGWSVVDTKSSGRAHVEYDILPHSPGSSFAARLYRVPQTELSRISISKPVLHPAVILYFDGFAGDRHIPSEALAARFPDDVDNHHGIAKAVDVPSILKLQSAEEDELLNYLRCDDGSVVQLAMAALEGMWLGECGEHPQERMEAAIKATQDGDLPTAREIVEQVVGDFPQYSYGWAKLGTIEYRAGNAEKAVGYYETALEKKPHLIDALTGLGACAARLQWWPVAHRAALQLLAVQPNNEAARMLRDNAIFATL